MNELHPLGQLIQSVEDSRGWTLREIARRIERAELNLSNAYLGKLKRQSIRSVSYETIRALAEGLDLPERVVGVALLESMGVHDLSKSEAGAAVAIARDPDLSERDRSILLAVIREMRDVPENWEERELQPPTRRPRPERSHPGRIDHDDDYAPSPTFDPSAPTSGGQVEDPAVEDGVTSAGAEGSGEGDELWSDYMRTRRTEKAPRDEA
ncbi:hypothetical protein [Brachybacterium kimchii]|uniref:HTH cro/C1-type domain-containing protein n=1 Tax=Brachybacterium kimchii TaxID=2942909 RepID=A0ABY4NBD3_9MICO|nr:hypothetical protein [Brachybacterium kimchii]UQN30694.1 hypothetical protein M4486_05160 [Brachybacterium kimchii]